MARGGAAIAGGASIALLAGCGGAGKAAAVAGPAATVAAVPGSGTGPYWYTRTTTTLRVPVPLIKPPRPAAPAASRLVWLSVRESTETWVGRDGTLRTRTIELSQRFASPADRARWLASKQPVLPRPVSVDGIVAGDGRLPPQLSTGGPDAGDGLFSSAEVGSLPTDVAGLRRRVDQAVAALGRRATAAFSQAEGNPVAGVASASIRLGGTGSASAVRATGDATAIVALLATPVAARVRAALVGVVETLPGAVTERAGARDPLGRPGVAVRLGSGRLAERLILDRRAGVVLSDSLGRSVTRTIVDQGEVPSIRALPIGLRPIPGPAPPLTIAVSPGVGGPQTTFTATVPATAGGGRVPGFVAVSGPSGPRCEASLPRPVLTASSAAAGGRVYRIGPAVTGRTRWCRGRYQVAGPGSGAYFEVR